MANLSLIKSQITDLFNTNPHVHISVSSRGDRKHLTYVPAVITGVYPNFFTATLKEDIYERKYTFKYVDIHIRIVEIMELNSIND